MNATRPTRTFGFPFYNTVYHRWQALAVEHERWFGQEGKDEPKRIEQAKRRDHAFPAPIAAGDQPMITAATSAAPVIGTPI
jgi:hypothetical protein